MFGDNVVGPNSDNGLYDYAMRHAPDASIGVMHDWYPLNKSHYNSVQALNAKKSRLKIPFMHFGECLHGVGSFKQSMFPQSIAMAASFDTNLVHRVGRAIGSEARSIGVHACLSPVLDLGKDPRFGRAQEAWGEDKVLTSHMGVAYASGLSKNGSWSDPDAVVPVIKHFAAYGAPQSGRNAAPWMGRGNREIQQELLVPFKAVIDNGGARGIMMSYNELDDVPAHVHPMLYQALSDWGFDGFVTADDTGMRMLQTQHGVSSSDADTIQQWFNAGGMIQYYDFPLDIYLNATVDLVANGTVPLTTLQSHVRKILEVKYDLGLFDNPYIPGDIDPNKLTADHVSLTLEAAQKSIVLLENRNNTLPLKPTEQNIQKIALIGPFSDILNYGDYSGQWGAYPVANSTTMRQAVLNELAAQGSNCELVSSWGSNTWLYNAQYPIPEYLLSADGSKGGLKATYYADTNFSNPVVTKLEVPVLDWGLYPPPRLPSNNFSAIWEGELTVPVDVDIDGWLGVAVSANTTAKLYVDGALLSDTGLSTSGNILSNIENRAYTSVNSTLPPPGSASFKFRKGATHTIRLEYQAWNTYQKIENVNSVNAELLLFWNLVDQTDAIQKARTAARSADTIILTLGSAWSSDGENGDRGTLGLSPNQTALADAVFALGKPVILVLQGGRPLAIPQYYSRAAAVLNAFFPGQAGGHAIADTLFGRVSPGARVPLTVPMLEGQLPVFYNQKGSAWGAGYVDADAAPAYPFGYGLSYTEFSLGGFGGSSVSGGESGTFTAGDVVAFAVSVENTGASAGAYVVQVYLLQRVSAVTQPVRQLVAFERVELGVGEKRRVRLEVDVDRFLMVVNRMGEWELEKGEYAFAVLDHGGDDADTGRNVSMVCV
ncbi:glycoside hydrolase family 3 protein [Aplosporella prunicola CBS 121167]|uniref:xylan 1,4-beta-xylosidase n=1 Tax=Aplosporella prunicola CBS 121167 TaxID=1176127 RepID=A0A6A6B0F7_9PEZI|nr:glycoside hydrolase family 3 protein [Aplosporella prunicola CBS 121167]KAF2137510.1 glycoside hydrolase family 3 protein [Aplosporella prunicola CBS 121167]